MRNLVAIIVMFAPTAALAGKPLGVPLPAAGAFGPGALAVAAVAYLGWRLIKRRRER